MQRHVFCRDKEGDLAGFALKIEEHFKMGIRILNNPNKNKNLHSTENASSKLSETFESQDLFRRAEVCVQNRNFERAESLIAEALKIVPDNSLYLSYYGLCLGMLGDIRRAENICMQAFKMAPDNPVVCVNLGRIMLAKGKRKEARELFARAYDLDNTNSAAALELAAMGVRRPPVIAFLPRENPINIFLGKIRYAILKRRRVRMKKL